jgi:hypothetical protein
MRLPHRRPVVGAILLAASGSSGGPNPDVKTEPPTVYVAAPVEKAVTDHGDYTGRTDAPEYVERPAPTPGAKRSLSMNPIRSIAHQRIVAMTSVIAVTLARAVATGE